jgi:hypothetical protein
MKANDTSVDMNISIRPSFLCSSFWEDAVKGKERLGDILSVCVMLDNVCNKKKKHKQLK